MKEITLNVQKREAAGRGSSRRLRAQGRIPAIVYGKSGNINLSVSEQEFKILFKDIAGTAAFITIDDGESRRRSIIRDIQLDTISRRFNHIDFNEVDDSTVMTVDVPVKTKGEAYGIKTEGGILDLKIKKITVRCRPQDLPESIVVDITAVKKGEAIHRREMPAIDGITYVGDPSTVILSVTATS